MDLERAYPLLLNESTVLMIDVLEPGYDISWRMSVHQSIASLPEPAVLCHILQLARAHV